MLRHLRPAAAAAQGVPSAATAAVVMSGLELGGLVGSWSSGLISDALVRRAAGRNNGSSAAATGLVGQRILVVLAYLGLTACALLAFRSVPAGKAALPLQWLAVMAVGIAMYGPQMLIGLCGAELVAPTAVGASQGMLGWIAYLGAANAGVPLSLVVQKLGWGAYFSGLVAACGLAFLLLLPLINAKSFKQAPAQPSAPAQPAPA